MVSSTFNLEEKIAKHRVIQKILRSLRERFRAKLIAIEEKERHPNQVDRLVGSI